jgi:hypothetical protein
MLDSNCHSCVALCLCADYIEGIVVRVRLQLVDLDGQVFQLHSVDYHACAFTTEITRSSLHTLDGSDTYVATWSASKKSAKLAQLHDK